MPTPAVLALTLLAQGITPFDLPSSNGRYVARARKEPGQELVDDRIARWRLTVRDTARGEELWSCPFPRRGPLDPSAAPFFLSADGSTLARLTRVFSGARPVVFIHRFGAVVAEIDGDSFAFDRSDLAVTSEGTTWLGEEDSVRMDWFENEAGPWLGLEIEAARGWTRRVDLSIGLVVGPAVALPQVSPIVHPELVELVRPPFVTGLSVPAYSLWGVPLLVSIEGAHPTPNWIQGGFELQVIDLEARELLLLPLSQPPPVRSVSAQVIERFTAEAQILNVAPGVHTLTVRGAEPEEERVEPRTFEVLPGRLRVRLVTTGGIAGVNDAVELFVPGVARVRRSFGGGAGPVLHHVAPDVLDRIDAVLGDLPRRPRSGTAAVGADLFHYRLGWWAGDGWVEVELDEGTARGAAAELIGLLRRVG